MLKKIIIFFLLIRSLSSLANDDNDNLKKVENILLQGNANFMGEVVYSSCNIELNNNYQSINLSKFSILNINNNILMQKEIIVKIQNCLDLKYRYSSANVKGIKTYFYTNYSDKNVTCLNKKNEAYLKVNDILVKNRLLSGRHSHEWLTLRYKFEIMGGLDNEYNKCKVIIYKAEYD